MRHPARSSLRCAFPTGTRTAGAERHGASSARFARWRERGVERERLAVKRDGVGAALLGLGEEREIESALGAIEVGAARVLELAAGRGEGRPARKRSQLCVGGPHRSERVRKFRVIKGLAGRSAV